MIEITGFTRVIWKPGNRETWEQRLARISAAYHKAEYETVRQGLRQACTIHIDLDNLESWMTRLNNDRLVFTPIARSGVYEGFAHKHAPVEKGKPYFWFGCVTRTTADGQLFKESEGKGTNPLVSGAMLGYPECCTKFFKENFKKNYDPVWEMVNGRGSEISTQGLFGCNVMLRYFGVRVISHFPCSFTCKATDEVAKMWLKVIRDIDAKASEWLVKLLSTPMTWNSYHGVVEVDTPYFLGVTHTFPFLDRPRIIRWEAC